MAAADRVAQLGIAALFLIRLANHALSPNGKECLQQICCLALHDAAVNLWPMVRRGLCKQAWPMGDGAALRVICAVIKAGDPGMGDGPGAHRAWFQCDPQVTTGQPIVAQRQCSGANRNNLGMRSRVMSAAWGIGPLSNHLAVSHNHSADGDFARARGVMREFQGSCHS